MECIAHVEGQCAADGTKCFCEGEVERCFAANLLFGDDWKNRSDLKKIMMNRGE